MTIEAHIRLPIKTFTLDDVAELALAAPDFRYELYKGVLTVMPPADDEHAEIVTGLTVWFVMGGLTRRQVLANAGVRVSRDDGGIGRTPDLIVRQEPTGPKSVWLDPQSIYLVVEVVSPGSEGIDRLIKPAEYAHARIPHFWRIERATDSEPTVHMYRLGVDEGGQLGYTIHHAVPLEEMLAGPVPKLD